MNAISGSRARVEDDDADAAVWSLIHKVYGSLVVEREGILAVGWGTSLASAGHGAGLFRAGTEPSQKPDLGPPHPCPRCLYLFGRFCPATPGISRRKGSRLQVIQATRQVGSDPQSGYSTSALTLHCPPCEAGALGKTASSPYFRLSQSACEKGGGRNDCADSGRA